MGARRCNFISIFCVLVILLLGYGIATALTIETNSSGELIGAKNVLVDGNYYDVEFLDGKASELFYLNGAWNFTFDCQEKVIKSAQALMDEVLIGDFNTQPELTKGIESETGGYIMTPYNFKYNEYNAPVLEWAGVASLPTTNYIQQDFTMGIDIDVHDYSNCTWARWSSTSSPVPEPATMLLFGLGILGLAGVSRKKK